MAKLTLNFFLILYQIYIRCFRYMALVWWMLSFLIFEYTLLFVNRVNNFLFYRFIFSRSYNLSTIHSFSFSALVGSWICSSYESSWIFLLRSPVLIFKNLSAPPPSRPPPPPKKKKKKKSNGCILFSIQVIR